MNGNSALVHVRAYREIDRDNGTPIITLDDDKSLHHATIRFEPLSGGNAYKTRCTDCTYSLLLNVDTPPQMLTSLAIAHGLLHMPDMLPSMSDEPNTAGPTGTP